MGESWPCTIKDHWLVNTAKGELMGFPQRGRGDRCLFCDQYDNCLSVAARCDWEGFTCRCCSYPGRTMISFFFDELGDIDDGIEEDDELIHCTIAEMDRLLLGGPGSPEDDLIRLIDSLEIKNE